MGFKLVDLRSWQEAAEALAVVLPRNTGAAIQSGIAWAVAHPGEDGGRIGLQALCKACGNREHAIMFLKAAEITQRCIRADEAHEDRAPSVCLGRPSRWGGAL